MNMKLRSLGVLQTDTHTHTNTTWKKNSLRKTLTFYADVATAYKWIFSLGFVYVQCLQCTGRLILSTISLQFLWSFFLSRENERKREKNIKTKKESNSMTSCAQTQAFMQYKRDAVPTQTQIHTLNKSGKMLSGRFGVCCFFHTKTISCFGLFFARCVLKIQMNFSCIKHTLEFPRILCCIAECQTAGDNSGFLPRSRWHFPSCLSNYFAVAFVHWQQQQQFMCIMQIFSSCILCSRRKRNKYR